MYSSKSIIKSKNSNIVYTYIQKIDKNLFAQLYKKIFYQSNYFYWKQPDSFISFLATGKIFSANKKTINKKSIQNSINLLNSCEYDIRNYPLFVGGLKFPLEERTKLWKDFPYEIWFIPEIVLINKENNFLLAFNFKNNIDSNIKEYIELKINKILNADSSAFQATSKIKSVPEINDTDFEYWKNIVEISLKKIESRELEKVVLARIKKINLTQNFFMPNVLKKLENEYPGCYIFAWKINDSIFFGASPEMIGKFFNNKFETDALAGSIKRGKTKEEDYELEKFLLSDTKNISEHNSVVQYILSSLNEFSEKIIYEKTSVKKLKNIQHLWTPIKAEFKKNISVNTVVKKIYPSPAVCGLPKEKALEAIKQLENFDRGLYAGALGWYNLNENGEFAVGIRSALIKNNILYIFAGCGVVKGSNAQDEFEETELKLKPMISLFNTEKHENLG